MQHYGFFDGDQYYGQEELARYFDNIYESGVSIDSNNNMTMKVYKEGSVLKVSKGFSIIKGFYLYNDSPKTINVVANPNYDRIDRIVIRLNVSTRTVSIEHKKGVAGSKPAAPNLQRDNLIYELSLAQIKVPKSAGLIVSDERYRKNLCGAIRPKNFTEFNNMIKGMTEQFDKWFNSQQSKGWRNIYIDANDPVEAVAGSIWLKIL